VRDAVTRDALGQVVGLPAFTGAKIDNHLALTYRAQDSFALDLNGFGGPSFLPSDKRTSQTGPYHQFLNPSQGEFFIFRDGGPFGSFTFGTLGLDNSAGLCFFAAGLQPPSIPFSGTGDYFARADGIARVGGQTLRLFGTTGVLDVNYGTGAGSIQLAITGRGNAFGDFTSQPATGITMATATLQFKSGAFASSVLSGSNGYTGTIMGQLVSNTANVSGSGGAGAVFTFELKNAQGDIITGAVVAERNLI
jgi:hypothetical protein